MFLLLFSYFRKEPASGRVVTLLVEEYFSLMNKLNGYVCTSLHLRRCYQNFIYCISII